MIVHLWVIVFHEIHLTMMANLEALVIYYNSGMNKVLHNIKMSKLSFFFFFHFAFLISNAPIHSIAESKAKIHCEISCNKLSVLKAVY